MAKALLIGDMHIDNSKSSICNSDRFNEIFNTFDLIKSSIYEYKPDYVIFFGDLFNSPYSITTTVISIISELISDIASETPVLLIVGNHDDVDERVSRVKVGERYVNLRASLLSPFSHYENVAVFDSPSVIKIQEGVEIAMIPYSNTIIDDIESLESRFTKGVKKILMGHFELTNVNYMTVSNAEVVNIPSAEDLIKKYKYDMALLGHVHDTKEYDIDNKIVRFIGSCRNVDFRNVGENKGIYILDFDNLNLTYIDNPYTSIFKTIHSFDEFKTYCQNNNEDKLAKTRIKYIYSANSEIKEINKLKGMFKSIQFQKNINNSINGDEITSSAAKEFEQLVKNDLVTKENLVSYIISFKAPKNKDRALETLNTILKYKEDK